MLCILVVIYSLFIQIENAHSKGVDKREVQKVENKFLSYKMASDAAFLKEQVQERL